MLRSPFDLSYDRLPDTLPIFPLDSILLLPGGQVPLNIYEPKYLNMVQDALASKDRMIGVVLPDSGHVGINAGVKLRSTGCAGRITSFEETFDGRFIITVTGYCRFDLNDEISTTRKYRRFKVDWSDYESDLEIIANPEIDKAKLVELLQKYVNELSIDMDWQAVTQTPNFSLVTFFSMSLPFNSEQKYQLLLAKDTATRADKLVELLEESIKNLP